MPRGELRTYAALTYLNANAECDGLARYVADLGAVPVRHLSTALPAARALFRVGADELLADCLQVLLDRYPNSAGMHGLAAEFEAFHGRPDEALRHARVAQLLEPRRADWAAKTVEYGYRSLAKPEADAAAIQALQELPSSPALALAAAERCGSPGHYAQLKAVWDAHPLAPADYFALVDAMATAASRADEVDEAIERYRQAIIMIHHGARHPGPRVDSGLAGKRAWQALGDLTEVLDTAGVPFFMAGGTALGLIREGGPLSADHDIDAGIFDRDFDREFLVKVFERDPRFDLEVVHPFTDKVGLRHRGGSPIDLFRCYTEEGQIYHDEVFVRWANTPFDVERCEFGGYRLPLPDNPDRFLGESYGPDWKTPVPGFDSFTDAAPNVKVTRPRYLCLHHIQRAYRAILIGDRAGARSELLRAGEAELAVVVGG